MPLGDGDLLGSFRIRGSLGVGGMGEVYRASDSQLGRDVAIKVLPSGTAQSDRMLSRFEREAQVLAALNHPNIATLHGFDKDGDTAFLVMEVVEGITLSERLRRGPMSPDEAAAVFVQIAAGLEAAHDRGVVHRDLKPGNIKISEDGHVKILDFGLAKATSGSGDDDDDSPTLTLEETREGTILGTPAYMSPEQARGERVDSRTDIWAFGVCLYEALTAKRPFDGRTATDILAAILTREPDPQALPPETPASMRRLLDRCLRKRRSDRLRNIGDARLDLLDEASPWIERDEAYERSQGDRRWPLLLAGLAGGALALVLLWPFLSGGSEPTAEPVHLELTLPEPWVLRGQGWSGPSLALSPDGGTLVYVAVDENEVAQLFERTLDSHDSRSLAGTRGGIGPFFSPDGEWVAFLSTDGTSRLRKVSMQTGAVVTICEVQGYKGGLWLEGDEIIFAQGLAGDLFRVSTAGGAPEPISIEGVDEQPILVHPMPNRRQYLTSFLRTTATAGARLAQTTLAVVDSKTNGIVSTFQVDGVTIDVRLTASGHLLYSNLIDDGLMALPIDLETLEARGQPSPVLEPNVSRANGAAQYALSDDGTLVYLEKGRGFGVSRSTLSRVERSGSEVLLVALDIEPGPFRGAHLSPDGTRVLTVRNDGRERSIWLHDLRRNTFTAVAERFYETPIWSPDGSSVIFKNIPSDDRGWRLFRRAANGRGDIEELVQLAHQAGPSGFTPDGQILLYDSVNPETGSDIVLLYLDDDVTRTEPWLESSANEAQATVSPDGRWAVYLFNRELFVSSFPEHRQVQQVASGEAHKPTWSGDGRTLYYANRGHSMMAVSVTLPSSPGGELVLGEPRTVLELDGLLDYSVSRDDQTIVVAHRLVVGGARSVRVVLDWDRELERLAPHD